MGFARGIDHLDGDGQRFTDFVIPRPHLSMLYHVKDNHMAKHAILAGDVIVVERNRPLGAGPIALVSLGGEPRLVRVYRDGPRFTFDDVPMEGASVELLGIASRVVRPLLP